jgi:hypothetical protein
MTQIIELADPRLRNAVAELQTMIARSYPGTVFEIEHGDEGEGIILTATVDLDDPDEVVDLVIGRVLDLQLEEGLPLHVVPIRTAERQDAMLAAR